MLVDQHDQALRVGPIHRSVAAMTMSDVQELADDRGDRLEMHPDREAAFQALSTQPSDGSTAAFVVSDGHSWAVLRVPRTHAVDAAVLHETLLSAWHIAEEQVGYHHSLDQALHATNRTAGLVIGMQPPTVEQVMESAARGIRMPRKSTSFGPKPRMGIIMRDFRDADAP
jgi:hypothetical protein